MPIPALGYAVVANNAHVSAASPNRNALLASLRARHRPSGVSVYPDLSGTQADGHCLSLCTLTVATTAEKGCSEINTGSQNLYLAVKHTTSHISLAKPVTWPHLPLKGQGNTLLPCAWKEEIQKYLVNKRALIQGAHTCILTSVYRSRVQK